MAKALDIKKYIGNKYYMLTVISEEPQTRTSGGHSKRMIKCICDCGTVKVIRFEELRSGITKSCGCYSRNEASKRAKERNTKHGMYNTPEYNTWVSMKKRCLNKTHKSYKNYGGRGISICSEWIDSFDNFIKDMGFRPSLKHSLDRIDNNSNYNILNCRWATKTEQCRNRRSNILIEYKGESKCLQEWANELGFSWQKLYYRIFIAKYDIETAFKKQSFNAKSKNKTSFN